jgi:GH25 family lysozyme M1 (1,4-beta-N-acetylmuramidase)
MPARVTAVALFGSAATVAGLVATDVIAVPSWADLDGIDVASHQHSGGAAIDWQTVAASGQSFAFIKATEGTGYVNPYFSSDSSKASAAGVLPGSYHYAKPGNGDARSQARYYASTLATGAQPSLPPTLDLEENGGLSADQLIAWVHDWVDEITTLTGRDPIIYTYYSFWLQDMANTTDFADLPLWLAYYGDSLPDPLPGGWSEATFWQYSGEGAVDGVYTNVDMNTYYGSDAQLQSLAGRPHSGTSAGDVADALKPITDAGTGEAGIANTIEPHRVLHHAVRHRTPRHGHLPGTHRRRHRGREGGRDPAAGPDPVARHHRADRRRGQPRQHPRPAQGLRRPGLQGADHRGHPRQRRAGR